MAVRAHQLHIFVDFYLQYLVDISRQFPLGTDRSFGRLSQKVAEAAIRVVMLGFGESPEHELSRFRFAVANGPSWALIGKDAKPSGIVPQNLDIF